MCYSLDGDFMKKATEFAHDVLITKISTQDVFVDMTMGNGNDTLFLCKIAKFVYAFDLQQIALDNTKKKFKNMCDFYEVPFYTYGTKDALGACIGKEFRASLALEDAGFCKAIIKQMSSGQK